MSLPRLEINREITARVAPTVSTIDYSISLQGFKWLPDSRYGSSKILAELIAEDYRKHRDINVITLRPRGFIPYWNREVYARYSDWARWFWKGAVHIDDVAAAVILSLDLISRQRLGEQLILTLDSAYEYTHADLDHWDAGGAGSTFKKYYLESLLSG